MTLIECKQSCENDSKCTGVDYGKADTYYHRQCYHNYGGKTNHKSYPYFDAYIMQGSKTFP
jgi:hypothetical protein